MKARGIISDTRRRKRVRAFNGTTKGMVLGGNPHDQWPKHDARLEDSRRAAQLDDYAAIGAQVVRFDLDWSAVEPTDGVLNWSRFDKIVNEIVARGLTPLPILHRVPTWARASITDGFGVTRQTNYPANMSRFATFCAAAVNRYKDRVKHWEVWNEPNLAGFWLNPNVATYTSMLIAAYPAIKAADPAAVVITAGLAAVPDDDGAAITSLHPYPLHKSAVGFIQGIYANGGKNYFDAIGFHPYSWPLPVGNTDPWNGWRMMHLNTPSIRSHMVANGDTAKQIWATEYGGPTGTSTAPAPQAVTDTQLSAMVTDSHAAWATYPWAGPLIWYEYWDGKDDLADSEANFGLLRNSWSPKPAYNTYLHLTQPAKNAFGRSFRQGVSSYAGCVDTRLNQAAPAATHNTETTLRTGGATGATDKSQVLIRFDNIIGVGGTQVPSGAKVIAAELQMRADGTSGHPMTIHRMLTAWTAASTWNSMTGGVTINSTEAADVSMGDYWMDLGGNPVWLKFDVTADVQGFVNGTVTNNGWLLEPTKESFIIMASSEDATVANRPVLYVTYVV
jgi:hypothetical protein